MEKSTLTARLLLFSMLGFDEKCNEVQIRARHLKRADQKEKSSNTLKVVEMNSHHKRKLSQKEKFKKLRERRENIC